ncbi:chorismate mutase [Rhodococcus sp. UNC23MFCrub1.1]|uniref:chorismate mutase n=1 Tax=Rhodococcus sp. UNC23MFCrub1.1 TaxID=1449068 RepID=UPI000483F8DC|nr:chorismate mutase [Rhodococcus sp. UNC23MFCrub1.1]
MSSSARAHRARSWARALALSLTVTAGIAVGAGTTAQAADLPLNALVFAAGQRLLIADDAASAKWGTVTPVNDPPREKQVLDTVTRLAAEAGLDQAFVYRVFRDQIDATEAVEYARFAQWKLLPHTAPTVRPDLSTARATIDALNVAMVDQLHRHRHVLTSPGCEALVVAAVADTIGRLALGADYAVALTRATASYCSL